MLSSAATSEPSGQNGAAVFLKTSVLTVVGLADVARLLIGLPKLILRIHADVPARTSVLAHKCLQENSLYLAPQKKVLERR